MRCAGGRDGDPVSGLRAGKVARAVRPVLGRVKRIRAGLGHGRRGQGEVLGHAVPQTADGPCFGYRDGLVPNGLSGGLVGWDEREPERLAVLRIAAGQGFGAVHGDRGGCRTVDESTGERPVGMRVVERERVATVILVEPGRAWESVSVYAPMSRPVTLNDPSVRSSSPSPLSVMVLDWPSGPVRVQEDPASGLFSVSVLRHETVPLRVLTSTSRVSNVARPHWSLTVTFTWHGPSFGNVMEVADPVGRRTTRCSRIATGTCMAACLW